MSDNERDKSSKDAGDSESSLQDELGREAKEGKNSIGDVASNRNLSGSSTWETLPDGPAASGTGDGPAAKS